MNSVVHKNLARLLCDHFREYTQARMHAELCLKIGPPTYVSAAIDVHVLTRSSDIDIAADALFLSQVQELLGDIELQSGADAAKAGAVRACIAPISLNPGSTTIWHSTRCRSRRCWSSWGACSSSGCTTRRGCVHFPYCDARRCTGGGAVPRCAAV